MNLLQKLKTLDQPTHNEQVLIEYMLNQPETFLEFRASELTQEVFVSLATLYRLLDKLGYNGLTQFKIDFAASYKKEHLNEPGRPIDVDYPINPTDSYREMSETLLDIYKRTGTETRLNFDYASFMRCVEMMDQATSVTIYTSSSNIYFARNFKFQMQEIGGFVEVPEDEFTQRIHAANSTQSSVALVVSYQGRSKILKDVMALLKENGAFVILISSKYENPLTAYADTVIYLASLENHYDKISSFSSRFSLLYIFDLLYSGIFSLHYQKNLTFKITNYQKINKDLK